MIAQIGIGGKLKFSQSLIMLLNNLLHSRTSINIKTKDAVTETSIYNAIKIGPCCNLCRIWSLKVQSESLPCLLIHTDNESLTILTLPYIILLTLIGIHKVIVVSQAVDPIIVQVDVSWKLDELLSLIKGLVEVLSFHILGIDQCLRILFPGDFNPKVLILYQRLQILYRFLLHWDLHRT